MTTNLYPPSPVELPKKLTALPASYQTRALLAILSILLFFLLYGALVAVLGYLVYWAFTYDIGHINKITILGKIGAIAGSVMLFFFTLKFIFKLKNHKRENRIKLNKKDYPELWSFILKICDETGAPKPKAIYADPDVNAYVSYTNMWLSLFLPVKKELTIGLGLVSCVNLSEFKAIMSHEFGHFSQRSMKIGSYIISANTIIHDMIFSRDKWDDLLDQWRASDLRLSFAAWIITPIIWLIRQVLNLFYQFLNIMYSSLSREMEFNADKVAISTSGSDAIISGLWKLDSGFEKWNNTINYAYLASQKKLFSKNLYTHNNLSLDRIKEQQITLLTALPNDKRGGKTYFVGSEHSKVNMYASHPPNDMRQDNAKVPFVACETNEDSPWLLFNNKEKLQQEMTNLIYEQYINKKAESFCNVEEFESFIASENHGKELLSEFGNAFENRFINIPEIDSIDKETDNVELKLSAYENLKNKLDELMKPIKEIELLMVKASEIAQGTTKDNSFAFKGKTYKKKTIEQGYNELFAEREKMFKDNFNDWDKDFCTFHLALAKKQGNYDHLKKLYLQHKELITFYKKALSIKSTIYNELNQLQSKEVTENDVRCFGYRINDLAVSLNNDLESFDKIEFIELPNIENTEVLKQILIEGGKIEKRTGNIFENGGFQLIMTDIENTIMQCNRVDQKNLGVILDYHKKLHDALD